MKGRTDAWVPKASASIIAGFGLYGLLALTGIIVLVGASADRQIATAHQHVALVLAIVTGSIYVAVLLYMCLVALTVRRLSSRAADLDLVEPSDMSTDQA